MDTQKNIKYIAYFDDEMNKEEARIQSPAAHEKSLCLIEMLNRLNFKVDVISPARTSLNHFVKEKRYLVRDNFEIQLFKSHSSNNLIWKIYNKFFSLVQFKKYLKKNIKKDDNVIVYHSLGYCDFIRKLNKKIGFNLILEMEEVYSDSLKLKNRIRKKEFALSSIASSFIFPTYTMEKIINIDNKKSVVIHGDYRPESDVKFSSGNNVIYSGTFNELKGGVYNAIKSSEFLPGNFNMFITGFGTPFETNKVLQLIEEYSKKASCNLIYKGFLSQNEYKTLLKNCQIGLCSQDNNNLLNLTSFPSKILIYLKNGLSVLSCKNDSITSCDLHNLIYFYESNDPKAIAQSICKVNHSKSNIENQINQLEKLYKTTTQKLNELFF